MLKNEKGFAISAVVYSLIILFLIFMLLILTTLSSRKVIIDRQKNDVLNKLNGINETTIYKENILNGAYPELYSGLTPVMYKDNNWVVADTESKWYDYSNQEWANAVILKNGITKNKNEVINISTEVQGMFVWVPRYEYKIDGEYGMHEDGTLGTQSLPGEIKVNFIPKTATKASDGYIIHSAFTFGDEVLSGIWVGKFETTGSADNPTILPSVTSLRWQNVSTQFITAQKFNQYLSNADSHMAKNSEWGAAAYLSQSKYGKYGNPNYTDAEKQVMINNCSSYITGIGADSQNASSSSSTCEINTYETGKGQAASTTGNITGIYDMSGGAWEYVMSTYNNTKASSGFISLPEAKYYDNYTSTSSITACDGGVCYGHALSETSGWYGDFAVFVSSSNPWFVRGGVYDATSATGMFGFYDYAGGGYIHFSFRIVVTSNF